MQRSKTYEALLVITTALVVFYLIGWIRNGSGNSIFLYIASGVGISGIFIPPLGKIIAEGWYQLAELLNRIMSKVLMTIIYLFILVPVALLSRISKKDRLSLRRREGSLWNEREHRYTPGDLDKLW